MSRYEDDDYDLEGELRRRRNRQPTDDTIEIIRRRDTERAYFEDEGEPNGRRRRYEKASGGREVQRRRSRRDDSIGSDRERVYYGDEEELDMSRRKIEDEDDADRRWTRRRQQSDDSVETVQRRDSKKQSYPLRGRGKRSDSVPVDPELGLVNRQDAGDEYYPRQRSPSIPRRRRNHSYRAPFYDDYDDSDDLRSPSPSRVYRGRFSRARDSQSSLSHTPSPPRGYRPRYREVSPPIYRRRRIIRERSFGRSTSRSSYSSSGEETVESQLPRKGKTRIPARIVSKKAIIDLGYPFEEDVCNYFPSSDVSLTGSRAI